MRQLLSSSAIPTPRFRYTPCVKTGPLYTVSGMVALDPVSGSLVTGGIAEETRRILENIKAAMPDYGIGFEHMISARIYTVHLDRFAEINAVWDEYFTDVGPPARTSVGVVELPLGALIEIEFAFYRLD